MSIRIGRRERARRRIAIQVGTVGRELLGARELSGLSRRAVAEATGVSESAIRRLELGRLEDISMVRLALVADAVGLEPSLKLYPTGAPLRDAPQLALLGRFRTRLHESLGWRTEVGLPIEGDLPSWDAVVSTAFDWVPVDAEARLGDLQALQRRTNLKTRDGGADRVILLVADTRTNRLALKAAPDAWRAAFPVDTRTALRLLGRGDLPKQSALIVL